MTKGGKQIDVCPPPNVIYYNGMFCLLTFREFFPVNQFQDFITAEHFKDFFSNLHFKDFYLKQLQVTECSSTVQGALTLKKQRVIIKI